MRLLLLVLVAAIFAVGSFIARPDRSPPPAPPTTLAAVCADYENQAAAQAAAATKDGDGDGIYCQSLPCPCSQTESASSTPPPRPATVTPRRCIRPDGVQLIGFSKTKYPAIFAHYQAAIRDGWPQILVVNRTGTDARRTRLLRGYQPRDGYDRDEYPPAVGRGSYRAALMQGARPKGWRASVAHVPSSENESHGSTMGIKLRRFCDGTKFRYRFY